jgi:hypothetical protein
MPVTGDSTVRLDQAARDARTLGQSADAAQRKAWADDKVQGLRTQLKEGADKISQSTEAGVLGSLWDFALSNPFVGSVVDYNPREKARESMVHLAEIAKEVDLWARVKRAWAQAGKDDTGYPYPWTEWERVGKVLEGSIKDQTGVFARYNITGNFTGLVQEQVAAVKDAITPVLTSALSYAKIGTTVAVVVLGGVAIGYAVRSFR